MKKVFIILGIVGGVVAALTGVAAIFMHKIGKSIGEIRFDDDFILDEE